MTLNEWLSDKFDDEIQYITWQDIWDSAVDATIQALLDEGNIEENYREEWTATANKVKED